MPVNMKSSHLKLPFCVLYLPASLFQLLDPEDDIYLTRQEQNKIFPD